MSNRVNLNRGCPVCAGRVPCTCNPLAALHPELVAAQWDREGNGALRHEQLRPGSGQKVRWRKGTMSEGWLATADNVVQSQRRQESQS